MNLAKEIDKARSDVREAERRKNDIAARAQALGTEKVEAEIAGREFTRAKDFESLVIENRSVDAVLKAKRDRVTELENMAVSAQSEAEREQQTEMQCEAVAVSEKACKLIEEVVSLRERYTALGFAEASLALKANSRRAEDGEPQLGSRIQCYAGAFSLVVVFYRDKVSELMQNAALQRNKILEA